MLKMTQQRRLHAKLDHQRVCLAEEDVAQSAAVHADDDRRAFEHVDRVLYSSDICILLGLKSPKLKAVLLRDGLQSLDKVGVVLLVEISHAHVASRRIDEQVSLGRQRLLCLLLLRAPPPLHRSIEHISCLHKRHSRR